MKMNTRQNTNNSNMGKNTDRSMSGNSGGRPRKAEVYVVPPGVEYLPAEFKFLNVRIAWLAHSDRIALYAKMEDRPVEEGRQPFPHDHLFAYRNLDIQCPYLKSEAKATCYSMTCVGNYKA
jgi:hypothetical protein